MAQNTTLYICKDIPWDNTFTNVRLFDSAQAANAYIVSKAAFVKNRYSYIARDNTIRVDGGADSYRDCNYIAWLNVGYTSKWYYAFIQNVVYLNDGTALISFEPDYFQTWFYNATVKPCFVEREHVNDDTIGLHTVPESVVMGDPVSVASSNFEVPHTWYVYATEIVDKLTERVPGLEIIEPGAENNECSGYYKIKLPDRATINAIVEQYTHKGKLECLISMFALTTPNSPLETGINTPDNFGGYTPKNNKLLCYPYNYCTLVMAGSETAFRYEWFADRQAKFRLKEPIYAGGSSYIFPVGYEKENADVAVFSIERAVPTGTYPTASFGANQFQNYLVQYGPQLAIGLIGNVAETVQGVGENLATGTDNGDGNIIGGVAGVAATLAELRTRSLTSNTVKGTQAVAQLLYNTRLVIRTKAMQILPEYAQIIDDYFSAYGYKVCRIKAPNLTGRPAWNFVKTTGATITGNIPNDAKDLFKRMFDTGVTLWHTNNIGDYTQNNSI